MILGLHVDEVDDDDATEIAQPQLTGDGGRGLDVGVEDGLFQIAMTDEGPVLMSMVVIAFGLIDDEVAAGFQLDLAFQGPLDLVLDIVEIEDRRIAW